MSACWKTLSSICLLIFCLASLSGCQLASLSGTVLNDSPSFNHAATTATPNGQILVSQVAEDLVFEQHVPEQVVIEPARSTVTELGTFRDTAEPIEEYPSPVLELPAPQTDTDTGAEQASWEYDSPSEDEVLIVSPQEYANSQGSWKSPGQQPAPKRNIATAAPQADLNQQVRRIRMIEQNGQVETAIAEYTNLGRQFGEVPVILHRLAVLYARSGQNSTAQHFFNRALAVNNGNLDLLADYGYFCLETNQLEPAENSLRQVLSMDPRNARAHNNLAILHSMTNRKRSAVKHFLKAGLNREQAQYNLATSQQLARPESLSMPTPQVAGRPVQMR